MNKELENLEHIKDVLISMNFAFDDITANCFNNVENALTPPTMGKKIENLTTDMVWDNDYGTLNDIVIIRKINEIINHINKEEEDE